jgi:amidase
VLTSYINHTIDETSPQVSTLFQKTLEKLKLEDVQIIFLDEPEFHPTKLSQAEVALYEFETCINEYLASTSPPCPRNLNEIISSNLTDTIALGPTFPIALTLSPSDPEYTHRLKRIQNIKLRLANLFSANSLDALIYPHQTILPVKVGATTQPGRNGLLTSLAGCPGTVIPMRASADDGVPIGVEVVGLWGEDWNVLGIAREMERLLQGRRELTW